MGKFEKLCESLGRVGQTVALADLEGETGWLEVRDGESEEEWAQRAAGEGAAAAAVAWEPARRAGDRAVRELERRAASMRPEQLAVVLAELLQASQALERAGAAL